MFTWLPGKSPHAAERRSVIRHALPCREASLMATAELHDILFAMIDTMDQIIEFWLTASFAVVIATHFLAGQMTRLTAGLLAGGYCLMSALLGARLAVVGTKMSEVLVRLDAAGETFPMGLIGVVRVLLLCTVVFGFCAVLFFLWRTGKSAEVD